MYTQVIQHIAPFTKTYQIGINRDILNKSTKEYILVTLYHEDLQAYFAEKNGH